MKKNGMKIKDRWILVVRRRDGTVKSKFDSGWSNNGITNTGFAQVAGLILTDVGGIAFDYLGIGIGTTGYAPENTNLETSVKRKAAVGTRVTTFVTNDTAQLVTTFGSADGLSGTQDITEWGVFTAVSGGVMLARQTGAAKTCAWDSGDTLQLTAQIVCVMCEV